MSNLTIIDYLKEELYSFDYRAFNEIDSAILAKLVYLNFADIVPKVNDNGNWIELQDLNDEQYFKQLTRDVSLKDFYITFLELMCESPRFKNMKLNYYTNIFNVQTQEQFCAITCHLNDKLQVLSFRGTDMTVTGWKEDFNMLFTSPVPSQETATKYVNNISNKVTGDLILTGHSKGGNLAVWANAFCKTEAHKRITNVYNLDGPGFPKDVLQNPNFMSNQNNVVKIVPDESIIGLLFDDATPIRIIESNKVGPFQHDIFSWSCNLNGFIETKLQSNTHKYFDATFNNLVYALNVDQKKALVETVFSVVSASKMNSLQQTPVTALKEFNNLQKAFVGIDDQTAKVAREMIKKFTQLSLDRQVGTFNNSAIAKFKGFLQ